MIIAVTNTSRCCADQHLTGAGVINLNIFYNKRFVYFSEYRSLHDGSRFWDYRGSVPVLCIGINTTQEIGSVVIPTGALTITFQIVAMG